jgi:hypothetical protein
MLRLCDESTRNVELLELGRLTLALLASVLKLLPYMFKVTAGATKTSPPMTLISLICSRRLRKEFSNINETKFVTASLGMRSRLA